MDLNVSFTFNLDFSSFSLLLTMQWRTGGGGGGLARGRSTMGGTSIGAAILLRIRTKKKYDKSCDIQTTVFNRISAAVLIKFYDFFGAQGDILARYDTVTNLIDQGTQLILAIAN